jgi:hypothetical protein
VARSTSVDVNKRAFIFIGFKLLMKEGVRQGRSTCLSRQIAFQSEGKIYAHARRLEEGRGKGRNDTTGRK